MFRRARAHRPLSTGIGKAGLFYLFVYFSYRLFITPFWKRGRDLGSVIVETVRCCFYNGDFLTPPLDDLTSPPLPGATEICPVLDGTFAALDVGQIASGNTEQKYAYTL